MTGLTGSCTADRGATVADCTADWVATVTNGADGEAVRLIEVPRSQPTVWQRGSAATPWDATLAGQGFRGRPEASAAALYICFGLYLAPWLRHGHLLVNDINLMCPLIWPIPTTTILVVHLTSTTM